MPGPITLSIEQDDGSFSQPLPFHEGTLISGEQPFETGFDALATGELSQIQLAHVVDQKTIFEAPVITVQVSYSPDDGTEIAFGELAFEEAAQLRDRIKALRYLEIELS